MDVLEAMETARATRHFTTEPVSDDMIEQLIYAATRAPSPMNTQSWNFVVVTDPVQRGRLADAFQSFSAKVDDTIGGLTDADRSLRRTSEAVKHLVSNLADVPVLIVVTGALAYPPDRPRERYTYSALYTSAQNILLAARSLGLGAAFTTLHEVIRPQLRRILEIPDDQIIAVTIPVGWPARPFGPVKRKPIREVMHRDRWTGLAPVPATRALT